MKKKVKSINTVKICWSGGKDSTCAVMQHILRGDEAKVVCYIPMFNEKIPLISKQHYEFILRTSEYFESLGGKVYFAKDGLNYSQYVTHIAKSGKCKGQIFGFPIVGRGMCGFKRDGKLRSLSLCNVGQYDYESIGIAYDEPKRHAQLNKDLRSILCELRISEDDAVEFCKKNNLYSPHYSCIGKKKMRDGCALCYNASQKEREAWFADYPEAIPLVMELQKIVREKRPDRPPLRGYRYFFEEEGEADA